MHQQDGRGVAWPFVHTGDAQGCPVAGVDLGVVRGVGEVRQVLEPAVGRAYDVHGIRLLAGSVGGAS